MPRKVYDPTGMQCGRLLVIRSAGYDKNRCSTWLCKCDCGNKVVVYGSDLKKGHTQSCGCLQRERTGNATRKHGLRSHPLYGLWAAMIQRCTNPNNVDYRRYGGRGIQVCPEWRESFPAFLAAVGPKPKGKSLDRYPNPNGNYEPGNVRWANQRQQVRNSTIRKFLFEGKTQQEWAEELGITQSAVSRRLKQYGNPYGKENLR